MRSLTLLLLAAIIALPGSPALQGQKKSPPAETTECGSVIRPEQVKAELSRKADTALTLVAPPIGAPYYLPMTIHFVHPTNSTAGFTVEQLDVAMRNLNSMWEQVGVQFFVKGDIIHIFNTQYFDIPHNSPLLDTLRGEHVVPKTINVYFTNLTRIGGLASFPVDAVQGILLDIDIVPINPSLFAHEVGHYFDLYHTHETQAFGVECPDGTECGDRGDRMCDTPADPGLINVDRQEYRVGVDCLYNDSVDTPLGCGGVYAPSTANIMSYSRPSCIWQFTGGQITKALNTLRNNGDRKQLITNGVRYVNPSSSDFFSSCTYDFPCKTLQKAIAVSGAGNRVFLKPGSYPSANINDKKLIYNRWGFSGVVQLVP